MFSEWNLNIGGESKSQSKLKRGKRDKDITSHRWPISPQSAWRLLHKTQCCSVWIHCLLILQLSMKLIVIEISFLIIWSSIYSLGTVKYIIIALTFTPGHLHLFYQLYIAFTVYWPKHCLRKQLIWLSSSITVFRASALKLEIEASQRLYCELQGW